MKFKGEPNQLVRITKVQKHLVRKVPKSIRFDKDGIYETESPYLCKRLSVKFEEVIDEIEEVIEELIVETEEELRLRAKEAGIKSWHVKSIKNLIIELEE